MLNTRIILGSQSKIRQKAMKLLNLSYECIPANINEKAIRDPDPLKMAIMLSKAKAQAIADKGEQGIIITSDAFMVFQGRIVEKPTSLGEAHEMLKAFSGNFYTFVTGLAVLDTFTGKMRSSAATCNIYLRVLDQEEITDYCERYPVLSFAGAHEGDGVSRFSERIEGNYNFDTAIPMKDLVRFLHEIHQDRLAAQTSTYAI